MALPISQKTFTARFCSGAPLVATRRIVRALASGKTCTSAYDLQNETQRAQLFSYGGGWSGWRFRRTDSPVRALLMAEPVTCSKVGVQ